MKPILAKMNENDGAFNDNHLCENHQFTKTKILMERMIILVENDDFIGKKRRFYRKLMKKRRFC
ncbi:MAG: hypothetical protein GY820_02210 [Gammaproteobacteria bacterium]|nr:hypothetical protein [Gammaproteobacteria bacterium]